MPLPFSTTYAPGSQVKSADLNALRDSIGRLTDPRSRNVHASALHGTNGAYNYAVGGYYASSGAGTAVAPLPIEEGDIIKQVIVEVYGNGAADITQIDVEHHSGAGGFAVLGTGSATDPPAAWGSVAVSCGDVGITAGALQLRVNYNAAGIRIGNIRVVFSRQP